jgi:hypothetical protein
MHPAARGARRELHDLDTICAKLRSSGQHIPAGANPDPADIGWESPALANTAAGRRRD